MLKEKYWVLVGTRPEVIKQIPLYFELIQRHGASQVALIGTGQHRELLDQALSHFDVKLTLNLDIMKPNQSLTASSAAILEGMNRLFELNKPEWIIVQGDTTSAAMAAWAAFQSGVKVAHNEAGLRSYNLEHPFPEEANRRLISVVADAHFAPTLQAKMALVKEGVDSKKIHVTGNTGIDALRWTLERSCPTMVSSLLDQLKEKKLKPVLLTAHRRENKDAMDEWFSALVQFLEEHPDLALIYPIHPNHHAKPAAEKFLAKLKQAHIIPATSYGETCHLLNACEFVVTDSGGIQEEATTLGLPVVVCRKTTERMEAVDAGMARLAGTEPKAVLSTMKWAARKGRPATSGIQFNLFGDGHSAHRIANRI